jgi:hypothetical protein
MNMNTFNNIIRGNHLMKTFFTIMPAMLLLASGVAHAQLDAPEMKQSRISGVEYYATNYGVFGNRADSGKAGFFYPRGSGKSYIFGSGLWFGAMKPVNDTLRKLTFITYNPNSGASYAAPGEGPTKPNSSVPPGLYNSIDYDRVTGIYNGPTVPVIPNWPLWAMQGRQVSTLYTGTFEPLNANRTSAGTGYSGPAFVPGVDEEFVARFHDGALYKYEMSEAAASAFGFPLGLQIHQNIYSWQQGGQYSNVVVLQYEILNVGPDTLTNCVAGQATDPDLGGPANDHIAPYRSSDGKVRAGVVFTEVEPSGRYGALANVLLESPRAGSDGFVDNSSRTELGAVDEISTLRNWTLDLDPATPQERYDFMASAQIDGDNGPGDKRLMLASKPFSMRPGDTAHFAIAFAVIDTFGIARHRDDDPRMLGKVSPLSTSSLDQLVRDLTSDYYAGHFRSESPSAVPAVQPEQSEAALMTVPNPASDRATIRFSIPSRSEVKLRLVNPLGQTVLLDDAGTMAAGSHSRQLDVTALPSGVYVVAVESASGVRAATLTVAH